MHAHRKKEMVVSVEHKNNICRDRVTPSSIEWCAENDLDFGARSEFWPRRCS